MPITAFGTDTKGIDINPADALDSDQLAERADAIDSMSDAFEDDSIIVVYREGASPSQKADRGISVQSVNIDGIPRAKAEVISEDSGTPGGGAIFHVDLPDGVTVGEAVAAAEADSDVVFAQPNFTYYLADEGAGSLTPSGFDPAAYTGPYDLPNDPYVAEDYNDTAYSPSVPNQWWIHAVNAPQAWSLAKGSDTNVAVAVLDTGITFEHEDLKNNILVDYAYDSYLERKLTESIDDSEMQHGTHVAGIIAAEANNGVGIAGVSYNAKILPIRVFHLGYSSYYGYETALCDDEDLIRAYDYLLSDPDGNGKTVAQETNTRVINMSLGGYLADDLLPGETIEDVYDYAFEDKIEQAEKAGILTVAAAGNGDGSGNPRTDVSYPSDYDAVMSVIALKTATTRTQWSDHNLHKNISAPGNNIYSTYWLSNRPYYFESGTSMATPLVAGCAALLWAYDPALTVRDVKDVLYSTADDLGVAGFDEYYGWGRVNIGAAIESLGTATVVMEAATMVRTTTQQLSASQITDRNAQHEWVWSVDDPSLARVDSQGVLTAIAAGKVTVTVTAADDSSIKGHRSVEIVDITIPGSVLASANPQKETIAVSWSAAEAAVSYRILRATARAGTTDEPGTFELLGMYSAESLGGESSLSYLDETAEPSELYWYKIVPVGSLDGAFVDGAPEISNRCFYTDKKALKAAIDKAEELLASTEISDDGTDIHPRDYWTNSDERDALNKALSDAYGAYMSGTMLQSRVDYYTKLLEDALAAFEKARALGTKEVWYTITWNDDEGTPLDTTTVKYGEVPDFDGAPTKQADAQYTYTFKEWSPAVVAATEDATYTAIFDKTTNTYQVTFTDGQGKTLSAPMVEYGKAAAAPASPVREGYTFAGWDKDFSEVTGDLTVNAKWTINSYTITWKDDSGKTLATTKVNHDTTPTYSGSTPTKAKTAQYSYTFSGWSPALGKATKNATYTAQFKATVNKYKVTFTDGQGKTLSAPMVEYGKAATAPANPVRPGYTFAGWDKAFSKVTGALTVNAMWTKNAEPAKPAEPAKTEDSSKPAEPSQPATPSTYTITWKGDGGKVLATSKVEEGKTPAYSGSTPTKAKTAQYTYTFSGWAPVLGKATKNATYTAQFKATVNTYKVTFTDGQGKTLSAPMVEYGKAATAPANPVRSGYTFAGWDKAFSKVTGALTVNATWTKKAEPAKPAEPTKTESAKPSEPSKPTETTKPNETAKPSNPTKTEETTKPTETSKPTGSTTPTKPTETSKPNVPVITTATSIAKASVTGVSNAAFTGSAITQKPVVKLNGKTLKEGTDYTLSYKNNVNIGSATITIMGKGDYTGTVSKTFQITKPSKIWYRLWGQTYYDTMQAIAQDPYGWARNSGGTVIVATSYGYWDALSAAGVAGLYNAPILITAYNSLSPQTKAELKRINPDRVIIAGGPNVVQVGVERSIRSTLPKAKVNRTYGQSATDTAAELAKKYFPKGTATDNTAILATSKGYWDALSASPISYAKHYPIFLVEDKNTISKKTLSAMKACGITKVIIAGGTSVVNSPVVTTLKNNGISVADRLWGQTLYDTSREVAKWGLSHGMSANKMGVATSYGYYDALCGAALCGKNNAVLVLADGKNFKNTSVPASNKSRIARAYVFGGYRVVENPVFDAFEATTK